MEWQELRVGALADHTQAFQTYAALLDEISEGHQKLYDQRKDLAKAQLLKQIKQSVKELKDLLNTIKKYNARIFPWHTTAQEAFDLSKQFRDLAIAL